jgi:hypothetical protein
VIVQGQPLAETDDASHPPHEGPGVSFHLSGLARAQSVQHRAHMLVMSVIHAPVHLHISMFPAWRSGFCRH